MSCRKKKPNFQLNTNAIDPFSPRNLTKKVSGVEVFSPSYDPLPEFLSLGECIGQGTTSIVRKGRRKYDDELVAVKIVKVFDIESAHNEIAAFNILSALRHPNIVRCSCIIGKPKVHNAILVFMELIDGSTLTDYVIKAENGRLPERVCCSLLEQLVSALDFIHIQRIVHRDLKPDNIMVKPKHWSHAVVGCKNEDPILKIMDFNSAARLADGGGLSTAGTSLYRGPEYGSMQIYTELSDVWSAGLCLFYMMCGEEYFAGHKNLTSQEYYEWLENNTHDFRSDFRFNHISNKGIQVLDLCLQKNTMDRPIPRMLLHKGRAWFLQCLGENWIPKSKENDAMLDPRTKENYVFSAAPSKIVYRSVGGVGKEMGILWKQICMNPVTTLAHIADTTPSYPPKLFHSHH